MKKIFLLSPAQSGGPRAEMLFNIRAGFDLARRLQRGEKRPVGEIFSFLSGLYFRGKWAYAKTFGRHDANAPQGWVITPDRGLISCEEEISLDDIRAFRTVPIDPENPLYRIPLEASLRRLARTKTAEFVLLGSISSDKYVTILLEALGDRLLFPTDFIGRGDMSRGGLLLRSVRDGKELSYQPVAGAIRRGRRPPKLTPSTWKGTPWEK